MGDAGAGFVVGVDPAGLQDPGRVGIVGAAARIGGGEGNRPLIVDELDALCLAAGVGPGEAIGRAAEEAFEALDLELQLGAEENIAVAADDDVACRAGQVFGLVVAQPVGADDDRAAPELDVAHRFGIEVGATAQLAGAQDDRQLLGRVAARRRLQRPGTAQHEAGRRAGRARRAGGRGSGGRRGLSGCSTRQDRQRCDGEDA